MKKIALIVILLTFVAGCITAKQNQPLSVPPQEVILKIQGVENVKVTGTDQIQRVLEVTSDELKFKKCAIHGDTAYVDMTSVSPYDSDDYWSDFKLLRLKGIKKLIAYMNNPGGSVFAGAALTDKLIQLKDDGIEIIIEAYGIVASAAIPPFLVASKRVVSPHTIFLIHPATIFKFFTSETLKDIESQKVLLELNRDHYADTLTKYSKLTREEVLRLLEADNWFDAKQALEWGMVDEIR